MTLTDDEAKQLQKMMKEIGAEGIANDFINDLIKVGTMAGCKNVDEIIALIGDTK